MKNKKLLKILFWFWFILIITIAFIPNLTSGGRDRSIQWGFEIRLDYIAHFLLYFIFAFLFICWKVDKNWKVDTWLLLGFIFGGLILGIVDEFHQKIIPGRTFNPKDMMYNTLGLAVGVILCYYVLIRKVLVSKWSSGERQLANGE
ncbi:VanZ family protein [candidate division KSB1 bacterium]